MILIDAIKENNLIAKEYKELLKISYQSLSSEDRKLIRLAFNTSVDAHKNQRRKSGEPYVFHPIAVAKIVASKIGLDATCIASALLHDVIEDTDYDEKKIEKLFGKTICKIVIGLTKISKLKKEKNYSYIEAGEGTPIIVLHGLMGGLSNFDAVIDFFSKKVCCTKIKNVTKEYAYVKK